jgi:phosphate-selective porin OprO/OprP
MFIEPPSRRSRRTIGPLLAVLVISLLLIPPCPGADASEESVRALQKLVEDQNQKIEALTKKIQALEQRESERTNPASRVQLPPIVIDTNGVPVGTKMAGQAPNRPGEEGTSQKPLPRVTVGSEGFAMSSADTNFVLRLKGLVQLDSRSFVEDNPRLQGNDSFILRRARPIIEGTVFNDFDFQLVPDFGGSSVQIFDAWLNYRLRPELQLRGGKFKGPVGFENLQSDATLPFSERSLVSNFVTPRNVGVQLWGNLADGIASYALGVFNGSGDARNPATADFSDDKEYAGRIALEPFRRSTVRPLRGLGLGVGGSYSQINSNAQALPSTSGGTQPGYLTTAMQQFFAYNPLVGPVVADGAHWRISPYVSYLYGPFGLVGEYAESHQGVLNASTFAHEDLAHQAWQVTGQWVLTGEPASFSGIAPKRPFNLANGGWGAWQLVARYTQLTIDDDAFQGFSNPATSANSAASWSVGINWWLNKNVRLMASFAHTEFDGGGAFSPLTPSTLVPPATVTHQDENVFFTRLQLAF